jgi:hypothetical protein
MSNRMKVHVGRDVAAPLTIVRQGPRVVFASAHGHAQSIVLVTPRCVPVVPKTHDNRQEA